MSELTNGDMATVPPHIMDALEHWRPTPANDTDNVVKAAKLTEGCVIQRENPLPNMYGYAGQILVVHIPSADMYFSHPLSFGQNHERVHGLVQPVPIEQADLSTMFDDESDDLADRGDGSGHEASA